MEPITFYPNNLVLYGSDPSKYFYINGQSGLSGTTAITIADKDGSNPQNLEFTVISDMSVEVTVPLSYIPTPGYYELGITTNSWSAIQKIRVCRPIEVYHTIQGIRSAYYFTDGSLGDYSRMITLASLYYDVPSGSTDYVMLASTRKFPHTVVPLPNG